MWIFHRSGDCSLQVWAYGKADDGKKGEKSGKTLESHPTSAETLLRNWGEWGQGEEEEEEDAGQSLDVQGNLISNLCTLSELFISAPFSHVCVPGLMGSVSHCQALHNPSSPGSVTKVKHSQLKDAFAQ